MKPRTALAALLSLSCLALAAAAQADGAKDFVARPKIGAATLELPSNVKWTSTAGAKGNYRVALSAIVDVSSVLKNIKTLSAKALDRSAPCGDVVKILNAAARLLGATSLKYDLRFRYVKRVCAGSLPLELPADVNCSARIALSAARSIITIDVRGAATPPCRIEGAYQSVSDAIYAIVGIDVFQKHVVDLAKQLPPEFRGVTIDIRRLAFDLPPAPPRLRIAAESTMSKAQYTDLMARLEAVAPATQ
jgi:hypothetical protein